MDALLDVLHLPWILCSMQMVRPYECSSLSVLPQKC